MPARRTRLTPLGARKQLLIAESDVNRARMLEDASEFAAGFKSATSRARSIGSVASSAAMLMASAAALRPSGTVAAGVKASPFRALLKGVGLLSTLWLAFRAQGRTPQADPSPSRDVAVKA